MSCCGHCQLQNQLLSVDILGTLKVIQVPPSPHLHPPLPTLSF